MRGGGLCLLVLTVLLAAACHLPERTKPEPGSAAALGAVSDPNCRSTDPRVCPPMRAMVSTGAPMVLKEYGISARFPAGSRVCYGLSGQHAHGFYTRPGDRRAECRQSDDQPDVSAISVWADYNAAFYRSLAQAHGPECQARQVEASGPDGQPFAIPGLKSEACVRDRPNGALSIDVYAFAGRWPEQAGDPDSGSPYLIYSVSLGTTADRLAADKRMFQRFLNGLVLTPPSPFDAE